MTWKINLSKDAEKFLVKQKIPNDEIFEIVKKSIKKLQGEDVNVDLKKLKGEWLGFFRSRVGKIRVIMKINFDDFSVFIEKVEYRGSAYKK